MPLNLGIVGIDEQKPCWSWTIILIKENLMQIVNEIKVTDAKGKLIRASVKVNSTQ